MSDQPRIPTYDDIHALPRWAKVALVGRCVERAVPIIRHDWPELPQGALFLIASAGGLAEASALAAHETPALKETNRATEFVYQAEQAGHSAAAHACAVCGIGSAIAMVADTRRTTQLVVDTIGHLADSFQAAGLHPGIIVGSVWPDYAAVRTAAQQGGWNNDTPVEPDAFGPLWPHGTPDGWPEDDATHTKDDEN